MEVVQQFIDVLVGAFNCCETACVLAGQGFGACPEEGDEEIFAYERAKGRGAAAHHLGQGSGRPADADQVLLPLRVERQQSLTDRLVKRPALRAVVKNVDSRVFVLSGRSLLALV